MDTQITTIVTDCLIPTITAAVGWLAGKRKRRNDALKSMQDSIDILSLENKRLIEDLTTVNREVVALRRETGELKTSSSAFLISCLRKASAVFSVISIP